MTEKEKCCQMVWGGNGFHPFYCKRNGVVQRGDKRYCQQHDPVRVEEKRKEANRKQEAHWAHQKEVHELQMAREEALEGFTLEELKKFTPEVRSTIRAMLFLQFRPTSVEKRLKQKKKTQKEVMP